MEGIVVASFRADGEGGKLTECHQLLHGSIHESYNPLVLRSLSDIFVEFHVADIEIALLISRLKHPLLGFIVGVYVFSINSGEVGAFGVGLNPLAGIL